MTRKANDDVRERILRTASELFYSRGVRAVGVDVVVEAAGVAKTSLYRHFRTKDDLIAAFLQREDEEFWALWDQVGARFHGDGQAELEAHMAWIGARVGRSHYRGCPQLNVAAEFPEADHPARQVASAHKQELCRRLTQIARRIGVADPTRLGLQLMVLTNGAFVSTERLDGEDAAQILADMARALVAAAASTSDPRPPPPQAPLSQGRRA